MADDKKTVEKMKDTLNKGKTTIDRADRAIGKKK